MAQKKSFPGPYVNTVPAEGADPMMEYVNFDKMGIGARGSGLPKENVNGIKDIDHVGGRAGSK